MYGQLQFQLKYAKNIQKYSPLPQASLLKIIRNDPKGHTGLACAVSGYSAPKRTCTQSARSASVWPLGRRRSVRGPGSGAARVSTVAALSRSACTERLSSSCSNSASDSSRRHMGALST